MCFMWHGMQDASHMKASQHAMLHVMLFHVSSLAMEAMDAAAWAGWLAVHEGISSYPPQLIIAVRDGACATVPCSGAVGNITTQCGQGGSHTVHDLVHDG